MGCAHHGRSRDNTVAPEECAGDLWRTWAAGLGQSLGRHGALYHGGRVHDAPGGWAVHASDPTAERDGHRMGHLGPAAELIPVGVFGSII